jgi:hypothetical protein
MTTAKDTYSSFNDTTVEFVTGVQERIIDAHQQAASAVASIVTDLPDWLPERPESPDTKGMVEESFSLQARLLEANKAFTLGVLDAWSEAAPKASTTKSSKSSKA